MADLKNREIQNSYDDVITKASNGHDLEDGDGVVYLTPMPLGSSSVHTPSFTGDLDNVLQGIVYATGAATNSPNGNAGVCRAYSLDDDNVVQEFTETGADVTYFRRKSAGTWQAWSKVAVEGSSPTFTTVNTGQGDNELYPMDQGVQKSNNVAFNEIETGGGGSGVESTDDITVPDGGGILFFGLNRTASNEFGAIIRSNETRTLQIVTASSGATKSIKFEQSGSGQLTTSFDGDVSIQDSLSKGSGTFLIDHPLNPTEKDLYHGFVEAPRYDLIYRGRVKLVGGQAEVDIDAASNMGEGTFDALTKNATVTSLQNQDGFARVKPSEVVDGKFTIECEDDTCTDEISWTVIAERDDDFIRNDDSRTDENGSLIPEWDKEEPEDVQVDTKGSTTKKVRKNQGRKGFPRHPKAHGLDEEELFADEEKYRKHQERGKHEKGKKGKPQRD